MKNYMNKKDKLKINIIFIDLLNIMYINYY